jgi:hypothetical protein
MHFGILMHRRHSVHVAPPDAEASGYKTTPPKEGLANVVLMSFL